MSANDAAYALATDVGGTVKKFVQMMNERAAELGLDHTLVQKIVAPSTLDLPVAQGDPVGEIVVYDGDRVVARRPLVSTETAGEPNIARRVRWYAGRALDEAGDMLSSLSPF